MTQIFELCGIRWCFILFCSSLQYRSSKITPSLFVDKASCTRQFENEFSLHSLASLFPIKEGVFSTSPSLLQGELHLQPSLLNSLYDPFGSPCRGQKPLKEECNRPTVLYLPHLSSIVFTTLSVPLVGDRNPSGRVLNPKLSLSLNH